jgi:hypothetical protein
LRRVGAATFWAQRQKPRFFWSNQGLIFISA